MIISRVFEIQDIFVIVNHNFIAVQCDKSQYIENIFPQWTCTDNTIKIDQKIYIFCNQNLLASKTWIIENE